MKNFTHVNQISLFDDVHVLDLPISVAVLKPVPQAVKNLAHPRQLFVLQNEHLSNLQGPVSKLQANFEAIKIALAPGKKTAEEKATIAAFSGWGGLSSVFVKDGKLEGNRRELLELLGEEAYIEARDSVLTAYYTEPNVVRAMWATAESMGFKGGKVLEPSSGTGNFVGAMPIHLRETSSITMVEPDRTSAQISKALYADSDTLVHNCGLENAPLRSDSFDVVIGNVPFGDFRVHDSKFDAMKLPIHDYMIAKSLDLVRPGGLVLLITSTGTLDKVRCNFRDYINERAELITAARLPSGAFSRLGGTDVAVDILVLQKRLVRSSEKIGSEFSRSVQINLMAFGGNEQNYHGLLINEFYTNNKAQVLGKPAIGNGQFGPMLKYEPHLHWESRLKTLANSSWLSGMYKHVEKSDVPDRYATDLSGLKSMVASGYFFDDLGQLFYMLNQQAESQAHLPVTKRKRLEGMVHIRNTAVRLLELDSMGLDSGVERAQLNMLYDEFVAQYDYLMKPVNRRLFSLDSHAPLLWSLERYDDEEEKAVKTDIFTKSTVSTAVLSDSAETLSDAIALSYNRYARLDLPFMATALGVEEEDLIIKLLDANRVFLDPDTGVYEDSDVYLSGKVRQKLQIARAAAEGDEKFLINVAALETVVPLTIPLAQVAIQLGVPWIGQADVQAFVDEVVTEDVETEDDCKAVKVTQVAALSVWSASMSRQFRKDSRYSSDWGTSSKSFDELITDLLNQRQTTVYMDIMVNDKKKTIVDKDETLAARDKGEKIQAAFLAWVFADITRVARLEKTYNDQFNGTVVRDYDGSHLVVQGLSPSIELRKDQMDGIWAGLVGGNKLFAYAVGGGKTLITICLAQLMKRLGLAQKPTIVVPNHMLEEFAGQYARAFPRARILAASKEDLDGDKRRVLLMRIATESWDCVIITHGSFGKIALSKKSVTAFADQAGNEIEEMVLCTDDRNVVRQASQQKKMVIAKVMSLADKGKKDDGVLTFEKLGIDQLLVDEADLFKNLWFQTKKTRVPGLTSAYSTRALDLFLKSRIIFEKRGDNFGLVFATATPIANTIGEMFIMQSYLQPERLRELKIDKFDAWAANFAREVTSIEVTPEGGGYRLHTRFSQFVNVPELMKIFKEVALIRTKAMLNLPEPKVTGGKHTIVAVAASEAQKAFVQSLVRRAESIRNGSVKPKDDNMLCVTGDGRKAALDMRCVDGEESDFLGSKLNACIENVYRHWEEGADCKLTQLVFCDLSTPNSRKFSVYEDMRAKLVARGIPIEEIAFAQDYDTTTKKGELHRKVRAGRIRILIGSTELMGFGTNVQDRLVAEHHLDAPWRPRDVEQRDGRIIRQGNMNAFVWIYRYVTESTFDAYSWQTLERKAGFIAQIMDGKSEARSVEDVTSQALSFAEVKAIASGNPLVIEKAGIDAEVSKILSLKASWRSDRDYMNDQAVNLTYGIDYCEKRIEALEIDLENVGDTSQITMAGNTLSASEKTAKDLMTFLTAAKAAVLTKTIENKTVKNVFFIGSFGISFEYHGRIGNAGYKFHATGKSGVSFQLSMPYGAADVLAFLSSKELENTVTRKLRESRESLSDRRAELVNVKMACNKPFEYEERLATAYEKQTEIDNALGLRVDDVSSLAMEEFEEEAEPA